MVGLTTDVLSSYPRFSVYNSPYVAHDDGCAIDLYPDNEESRTPLAPSPVAGKVVKTRTVTAPAKPYAVAHDHLIVVDTGDYLARMLHVAPTVEPGETVEVGDSLGELVRSGFFAPWVANHIHLGFREHGTNPVRASGSLPLDVPVEIEPIAWDGSGRVVETGETFVVLDSPTHPAPGERFAGIEAVVGADGEAVVLDGGLPHYEGGGVLRTLERRTASPRDGGALRASDSRGGEPTSVSLLGAGVGQVNGRTVTWDDVDIRANGEPITGLSLFVSLEQFGAKLVYPGHDFSVGDSISVSVR
ncbi:hypothetical protein ZOD2009_12065 [Haladaptatus paucihalophilus DX253]|uniref:Uncharacterized protein n=1 Tax=Haladaptatus paucihalophilus DX253 TaxID=797209 RepID=E7QUD3_HALPU|nr:hypothetical protein [Haladaptatus paucihalophilus]EFW92212.1 hypothetical protein ZOD2009_12065 [Haladaptatus paucihalophilus DX253]SHK91919.1 hypothetical protein SAMN05444342_2621 [Haladaptatus paucihalophilus DX253]